jgi:hypothetical protein
LISASISLDHWRHSLPDQGAEVVRVDPPRCCMRAPIAMPFWTTLSSRAVNPVDESHTVYYYSACFDKGFATEAQLPANFAVVERAFAEDRAMIEAQQQVIWKTPEPRMHSAYLRTTR